MRKIILLLAFSFLFAQNTFSQTPARIKSGIVNGMAKVLPTPNYPQEAKDNCVRGQVKVQVEINEKGIVTSANTIDEHPLLGKPSVLAAKRARFTPTYENKKPVKAIAKILYKFLPADRYRTEVEVQSIRVKRTVLSGHFLVNLKRTFIAKPDYSKAAFGANIKGEVLVKVLVDEFGNVIEAKVVSGHPLLHKESLKAALLTKFEPPKLSNQPINVEGILTYTFN